MWMSILITFPSVRLEDQGRHPIYRSPHQRRALCSCLPATTTHRGMLPTTSLDSQQQYHQRDDPRDGEDISTSLAGQRVLPGFADPADPGPPRSLGPPAHASFDLPGWKCLTRGPLATRERISLITTIFSNRDEIEMIRRLCGEDAQIFIDRIYEVH